MATEKAAAPKKAKGTAKPAAPKKAAPAKPSAAPKKAAAAAPKKAAAAKPAAGVYRVFASPLAPKHFSLRQIRKVAAAAATTKA